MNNKENKIKDDPLTLKSALTKFQDLNIIDLGRLDLEKMFPNLGLSGEARLYYNRKTNQFLRK